MQDLRSGMVDIVRDFLVAHQMLSGLFARFREGSLNFEEVRPLVGDDESSALYRLKERCHAIFRPDEPPRELAMRKGVLFDLAVGSLFHEAMKLRENLYQQEFYQPRVEALRADIGGEAWELFDEFEKILAAATTRLEEALREAETLLAQTRKQLRLLLVDHRENGLIARSLYEQEELVADVFPEGINALFAAIYGTATEGYMTAAHSYLESAYFTEALAVLGEAASHAPERDDIRRLTCYGQGMQAFLARDYSRTVKRLGDWLEADPVQDEGGYAELALAVVSRVHNLIDGEQSPALVDSAKQLAERIRTLPNVRNQAAAAVDPSLTRK